MLDFSNFQWGPCLKQILSLQADQARKECCLHSFLVHSEYTVSSTIGKLHFKSTSCIEYRFESKKC